MYTYGYVSGLTCDGQGNACFRLGSFDRVYVSGMPEDIHDWDLVLVSADLSGIEVIKDESYGESLTQLSARDIKKITHEEAKIFDGLD